MYWWGNKIGSIFFYLHKLDPTSGEFFIYAMKILINTKFERVNDRVISCTANLVTDDPEISKIVVTRCAKCSSEDEFNQTTGERLAESRARIQLLRKCKRIIRERLGKVFKELEKTGLDYMKVGMFVSGELDHLRTLMRDA